MTGHCPAYDGKPGQNVPKRHCTLVRPALNNVTFHAGAVPIRANGARAAALRKTITFVALGNEHDLAERVRTFQIRVGVACVRQVEHLLRGDVQRVAVDEVE